LPQTTVRANPQPQVFDQPVLLRQSMVWSRAIIWTIIGVTTAVVLWAAIFEFQEAVAATGKLEPQGAVQTVQSPVAGVVRTLPVTEGQRVKKGQLLLSFLPTVTRSQVNALDQVRNSLFQENQAYRRETSSPEMAQLLDLKQRLQAENESYLAQLKGQGSGGGTDRQLAVASLDEQSTRLASSQLNIEQLQKQLEQSRTQLTANRDVLTINQQILQDITPLYKQGGLAQVQFLRQQQDVRKGQADVDRLTQEVQRLSLAVAQAQAQLANTQAVQRKDLLTRITENRRQMADVDSRLAKTLVDNEKQISQVDGQLSQARLNLQYQELRAPVAGTVFNIKPKGAYSVIAAGDPVLDIVPQGTLVAQVYITNRDIGFVREGMPVDIRIDSFPFMEFGDIKGRLVNIGSDALAPTQLRPYYHFPARIVLDRQSLSIQGREVNLQSGMSVSANIQTRKRTVLSIFTSLFIGPLESLKTVR